MNNETDKYLEFLKDKYYKNWVPHLIKGITIEIIPLPRDIPVLETQGYNPLTDTFNITFKTERESYEHTLDDMLSILQDERGYVAGLKIKKVRERGIEIIEVNVKKKLEDLLSAMKERIESIEDRSIAYKNLGQFDLNQRAINFLEELTEKNLEKLNV